MLAEFFAIGDRVSWAKKIPWHRQDGPFIVRQVLVDPQLPSRQLLVVELESDNWTLLNPFTGQADCIAAVHFHKID